MKIKMRLRNWVEDDGWQVAVLPHFSVFSSSPNLCLAFSWLHLCFEIWIGRELEDLL